MGRPEKPIPADRPFRFVAEYLRTLRRRAGSPSYRILGKHVFAEHQALSQTANGQKVGWGRILLYIRALRTHAPDAITAADMAHLKRLFDDAQRAISTGADHDAKRQAVVALWQEVDATTARSSWAAAQDRAPGQWHTTAVTDRRLLHAAHDGHALYRCLRDAAGRAGVDLRRPPRPTATPSFSWFASPTGGTAAGQAWPRVENAYDLTLEIMLQIVRLCGGTEGDCQAWHATWERIYQDAGPPAVGPADDDGKLRSSKPSRFPQESPLWRWPGQRMRRPNATGRSGTG